ncbi:MAG: universal stress protein [Dehalococcoidia bacterium]
MQEREPARKVAITERDILVPLDGSPAAEAALVRAYRLAEAFGCGVTVLRVLDSPNESREGAEQYLTEVVTQAQRVGVQTRSELRTGKPADCIREVAATRDSTIVVLTTRGVGGDPKHLGSVAERLSRTLTVPALFVPPGTQDIHPLGGPVLVALDGSATAEVAIEPAIELARALRVGLTLVQVAPWGRELFASWTGIVPPNADEEIELGSNTYLAALVERLSDGLDVEYQTLRGHAADLLVQYTENQAGTLILASHGHTGLHLWGLGSTTDKVLRVTPVPVLLIRVAEHQESDHPMPIETGE